MTPTTHDTQREMEQRALRNVRALVDKMETTQAQERRVQRHTLLAVVVVAVALCGVLAYVVIGHNASRPKPVAIDPAKLPPVKAGPQRP